MSRSIPFDEHQDRASLHHDRAIYPRILIRTIGRRRRNVTLQPTDLRRTRRPCDSSTCESWEVHRLCLETVKCAGI